MTTRELIKNAAAENKMSFFEAERLFKSFIKGIEGCLKAGDEITIQGFGTIRVRVNKGRTRNVFGKLVTTPDKKAAKFYSSKKLDSQL